MLHAEVYWIASLISWNLRYHVVTPSIMLMSFNYYIIGGFCGTISETSFLYRKRQHCSTIIPDMQQTKLFSCLKWRSKKKIKLKCRIKVKPFSKHTSQFETPGSSVAGKDWLPPLPKATPILTSGMDTNEYRTAFPSRIGITKSCKKIKELNKLYSTIIKITTYLQFRNSKYQDLNHDDIFRMDKLPTWQIQWKKHNNTHQVLGSSVYKVYPHRT